MEYRLSVSLVVVRGQDVLVVTSRKWGGFSLPGGKVDPGETFDEAARRELLEETGCKATKLEALGAVEHMPVADDPNRNLWLCMCYRAEIGTQVPKVNEEGTEPYWIDPREVADRSLYRDFTREILTRAGVDWNGTKGETFSRGEMEAIALLAVKAAKSCGGGEDIMGAILYTGGHRRLADTDGAVVELGRKIVPYIPKEDIL